LNGNEIGAAQTAVLSGLETGISARWPGFSNAGAAYWNKVKAAGFKAVRIYLNDSNWLGTCDGGSGQPPSYYQGIVQQTVNAITAAGLYTDMTQMWSAPNNFNGTGRGAGCAIGQPNQPDSDHAVPFWTSVAAMFKNNPAVIFELFNEPFGTNVYGASVVQSGSKYTPGVDAFVGLNGGSLTFLTQNNAVSTNPIVTGSSYTAVGTQAMLNAIRSAGATNVVLNPAPWWAGEIEVALPVLPVDPLGQLGVSWHIYGYAKGTAPPAAVLAAGYPIWITETEGLGQTGGWSWVSANNIPCGWFHSGDTWGNGALSWTPALCH
jgi:hypothetical protein